MRTWLLVVLCVALLTGCNPVRAFQERKSAERSLEQSDALVLGVVDEVLPSYEQQNHIYTDTKIRVVKAKNVNTETVTLRRSGGLITDPGSDVARLETVDYTYQIPPKGHEVFLLLRRSGDKFEVIDAMPLKDGQPLDTRPSHQVYLTYLRSLK